MWWKPTSGKTFMPYFKRACFSGLFFRNFFEQQTFLGALQNQKSHNTRPIWFCNRAFHCDKLGFCCACKAAGFPRRATEPPYPTGIQQKPSFASITIPRATWIIKLLKQLIIEVLLNIIKASCRFPKFNFIAFVIHNVHKFAVIISGNIVEYAYAIGS